MGITVLPRDTNPWVAQLPQFVQQMAFQQIGQKFQEKRDAKFQDFRAKQLEEQRRFRMLLLIRFAILER